MKRLDYKLYVIIDYSRYISEYHIRTPVKARIPIWNLNKNLGNWRDKAGGYGIQEPFGVLHIKEIQGDYYNVMGLPVSRLYRGLREFL